jgi:hypothetical protein
LRSGQEPPNVMQTRIPASLTAGAAPEDACWTIPITPCPRGPM